MSHNPLAVFASEPGAGPVWSDYAVSTALQAVVQGLKESLRTPSDEDDQPYSSPPRLSPRAHTNDPTALASAMIQTRALDLVFDRQEWMATKDMNDALRLVSLFCQSLELP